MMFRYLVILLVVVVVLGQRDVFNFTVGKGKVGKSIKEKSWKNGKTMGGRSWNDTYEYFEGCWCVY